MNEGHVVHASPQVRHQVAHPFPALAVLPKVPLRTDDSALVAPPASVKGAHVDRSAVAAWFQSIEIRRRRQRR